MGMGLCVAFIAFVRLPSLKVSTLLLTGLLIYDVFWVFFSSYIFSTNVMVKVSIAVIRQWYFSVKSKEQLYSMHLWVSNPTQNLLPFPSTQRKYTNFSWSLQFFFRTKASSSSMNGWKCRTSPLKVVRFKGLSLIRVGAPSLWMEGFELWLPLSPSLAVDYTDPADPQA